MVLGLSLTKCLHNIWFYGITDYVWYNYIGFLDSYRILFWEIVGLKTIPQLRWFSSETRMLVKWVIHSEWPSLGDSVPPAPWHPLEGFMAVFCGGYWVCCMVPSLAGVIGFRPLYMLKHVKTRSRKGGAARNCKNWNMTGLSWSHVQYRMT